MIIKTIKKETKRIARKKILLRVDFNVPIKNGKIEDDFKIVASLPTIRFLLRYKCKIIIITHLGKPFKKDKKFSVKPIAERLEKILGKKVDFSEDCIGFDVGTKISKMKERDIILLENLRFYKEEEKNDKKFAKELANLADLYVNNAFAVSHRSNSSIDAIKKFIPSFAGLLLEKEIENLNKVLYHTKYPLILVLGGVKTETKIPLINNFIKRAEKILIGGALANNFLAARGLEVGKSLINKKGIAIAKKIKKEKILLPLDVVVGKEKSLKYDAEVKSINNISKDDVILDIGPETIRLYSRFIKKAQSIIWNGPMGYFENNHFKYGTLSIARLIAERSTGKAFGVVGGGETVEALKTSKMIDYVDWVSTGGGAMLTYLGGKKMPGLNKIIK